MMRDGKFSVWIIGQAMVAGIIVRAGTFDGGIILGDVEVDGPRAERLGEGFHSFVKALWIGPVPIGGQDGVFGSIETHDVKEGVCHIGLEAQGLRPVDAFQEIDHFLPTVHSTPADFAFSGEAFTELISYIACLRESLDDLPLVRFGILGPICHAGGGIDADNAIRADAQFAESLSDAACLADLLDEALAFVVRAHGGTATGGSPDGRDHRADDKAAGLNFLGELFDSIVIDSDVDMGVV